MPARIWLVGALLATCLYASQQPALAGSGDFKSVTYPVADVIIPIKVDGSGSTKSPVMDSLRPSFEANLVHAITTTIDPASWADAGGNCTIKYCKEGMALAITQTVENHERISDLLAAMRRFNGLEVALEVRMLKVPEPFLARLESDFDIHFDIHVDSLARADRASEKQEWSEEGPAPASRPTRVSYSVAFMTHDQELRLAKAIGPDRRCQLLAMPRLTVFNGQAATITVQDTRYFKTRMSDVPTPNGDVLRVPVQEPFKAGCALEARPVVSADRRFVRVALDFTRSEIASQVPLVPVQVAMPGKGKSVSAVETVFLQRPIVNMQHLATTVAIPDGGTAMFCGPVKKPNTHAQADGNVMGKIPYFNRLFTNAAYDSEPSRVLFMVTPRIIINEETEQIFLGKIPPIPREQAPKKEIVQAVYPAPRTLPQPIPATPSRTACLVGDLLKAYDEACAAGHADEAERLARAALALDATCFQSRR
jgi:general secretion pathway protein D